MEGEPKGRQTNEETVTDSLYGGEENHSEQAPSYEALNQAVTSARALEGMMKEREDFSKQLFTPAQAEAFSHTFEMASESIKVGDVEGFNQELANLESCFDGYGANVGDGMREDLGSLENIKREFGNLKEHFDTFVVQVEGLSGIDKDRLDYMRARFERIDEFHSKLYTATARFLMKEAMEPITQKVESGADQEQDEKREKRFYFGRMIENMSDDMRSFGSKIQQRYEGNATHQLMSPADAQAFVAGLESVAGALRRGHDQSTIEAFDQVQSSFSKYGTERGTGSALRESPENLRAAMQTFSNFNEKFTQFAVAYQGEQSNPEIIDRVQRLREEFSRADGFNRKLMLATDKVFRR